MTDQEWNERKAQWRREAEEANKRFAFARPGSTDDCGDDHDGLTKREYFAARTLSSLLTAFGVHREPDLPSVQHSLKLAARLAVAAADALMLELGDGEKLDARLVRSAKSALNLLERVGVKTADVSTLAALRDAVSASEQFCNIEMPGNEGRES